MKESNRLFSAMGLLLLLNALIKPLWIFGVDRQVQNLNGTEAYGLYFSLLGLALSGSFLLDWGMSGYINRRLAADPAFQQDNMGRLLLLKLLQAALYSILLMLIAFYTGVTEWEWLILLAAIQIMNALFLFMRALITARQWFKAEAWFSVFDKGLMLLFCGTILLLPLSGGLDILLFLRIQLGCTIIAALAAFLFLRYRGQSFHFKKGEPLRRLFREALPFAVIVMLMSVHNRLDAFLLERIHPEGAYQAGIYAGAYRLLDAGNIAGYLVASLLLPFLAAQGGAGPPARKAILVSRHILLLFSIAAGVTAYCLATPLQQLLYHNQDAAAVQVLQFCLPVLVAYSVIHVYGTLLTAFGWLKQFSLIVLAGLLLNILFNLWWIPAYGATGCCYAALVSQGLTAAAVYWLAIKKNSISHHTRSWIVYILSGFILFCFLYFGKIWIPVPWILLFSGGMLYVLFARVWLGPDLFLYFRMIKK